ncbi:MAG: hypothetical protein EOL88_02300 [Bacteroidia bacterium]|nr:hypothetical protein [Bacteroidia bacterium]
MAYLLDTVLATYMAKYDAKLDQWEQRKNLGYGAITAVMQDTKNTVNANELEENLTARGRAEYISVLQRPDFDSTKVTTSPSCTMIDNSTVSAKVGLTWAYYENGFHMIPSQYGDNVIGYERDFKVKMDGIIDNAMSILNTAAISHLETNKSQVNNAEGNPYAFTGNSIIVPTTNQNMFFNEIDPMMLYNNLDVSKLNIVATPRVMSYVRYIMAQGAGNAENLAFQNGNHFYYYDSHLTIPTSYRDVMYMFPSGSVGMLNWIEQDNRIGQQAGDGMIWGNMELIPGLTVGTYRKSSCNDSSAEAGRSSVGYEASLKDQFKIGFWYSFVTAYNSTPSTVPGTIFKAQLAL